MSSMLEEAIIDAQALKEAAKKSAEEKIIEHFSDDIKEAVNIILEQDIMDPAATLVPGLGTTMAPTAPFMPQATPLAPDTIDQSLVDIEAEGTDTHAGESVVKQTPYSATTSDRDVVSIDLDKLEESIRQEMKDYDEDGNLMEEEEYELDDDMLEEGDYKSACYKNCVERGGDNNTCADVCADEEKEQSFDVVEEDAIPYNRDWREDAHNRDDCKPGEIYNELDGTCGPAASEEITMEENLEDMIRNILAEESADLFEGDDDDDDETSGSGTENILTPGKKMKQKCKKLETWNAKTKKCEPTIKDKKVQMAPTNESHASTKKALKEHKQLNNKVKLLEEKLNKYQEVFPQLKQQLEESNLQNARLHYQNRVLSSASLNERQKDRLVETISKANTVEEAKIIYETLQSAVGANATSGRPKSLNEVVTKSSSAFMPRTEEKRVDPLAARMKALAGITDK